MTKPDYGCPTFDKAVADLAAVVNRSDSKFTPGEAEFWLNTLINAYKSDTEAKS